MAQTLDDFISKVGNYGIARNNKFEILLPKELDSNQLGYNSMLSDTSELATFYAESVEIPGKVINTIKTRIQGKNVERPYEFLYEGPLSITFLVDTKMQIRKYFDDWMNLVLPNGNEVSFSPNLPRAYKHAMTINILDNIYNGETQGDTRELISTPSRTEIKETGTYVFYDVYPKYVSGVNSIQSGKDFQKIKVVFEFDYMTCEFPQENSETSYSQSYTETYNNSPYSGIEINSTNSTSILNSNKMLSI